MSKYLEFLDIERCEFWWQLLRWVKFAESFLKNSDAPLKALTDLNEELIPKSVLLGNGLKPSPADVIVYVAVHSYVVCGFH